MTSKHEHPKTPHSATVTDSALKEAGATGNQSAVFDQILFSIPDNELNSTFAQASIDTNTKTMTLSLANWNHSDSHVFPKSQEEPDLRRADCHVEQIRPMEAEENITVQCFSRPGVSMEEPQKEANTASGEILLDVEPSLPVVRKQGFLNGPQSEEIFKNLELLRDNGKFEDHERKVNFFLRRYVEKGNKDMELALIIEKGVSFMYNKQLSKSKRCFTSVIERAEHCQLRNPKILIARAYFLLGRNCSCRKPRDISTFLEHLKQSEDLLQNHESPEDLAELYHFLGTAWLAHMSKVADDDRKAKARKELKERAKYYYERAIDICKKDPRSRIQNKRLTYCHLSLAAILLDCSSPIARAGIKVIPQDLKVAKRHLDIVQYELGDIPRSTWVQILKRRSDYYYRQGPQMYQLAKETAQEAFDMAHSHGFNTELKSLQERMDSLDQLCEKTFCREKIKLLVDGDSSTSGSDSRFETSCGESDEKEDSL